MKKRLIALLLAAVMVASTLTGCAAGGAAASAGTAAAAATETAKPKVLRVARGEDVTTWDPYDNTGINLIMFGKILYNCLVQMTADGEIVPDLATEWTPNADGTEWTFKLRSGVKFQDGTPFNAEAVKTSLERYLTETLSNGNLWTSFTGAEVIDDNTVKLCFSQSNGALPNILCETPILNPTTIKNEGAAGLAKPCGTGPYKFVSWEMGNKVVFEKNPDYWGDPAQYDTIEFYVIQEDSTRLAAVQTGDVDIADQIPADLAGTVEQDPSVQIKRVNGQDNMFLGLKCDEAPFDDVNARLAVMYGINRQSLVDNVVLGGGVAHCIFPKGTMGYDETVFGEIKYDPDYAKECLAKTSYAGEELEFIAPIGWYTKQSEQCQAIIADLKEVGFNIKLTMLEGATFSSTRNSGQYKIYTTGCAHSTADPNTFLSQRVKGDSAKSGYVNEKLNQLIDEGAAALSPADRQAKYVEVARIMLDEAAPMVPLFTWERIYAVSDKIDIEASKDAFRPDLRLDFRYVNFK